jgi:hypothetical protein
MLPTHLIIVLLAASVVALIVIKLARQHELLTSDGGLYGDEDSAGLLVAEILAWVLSGAFSFTLIVALAS